jgi:hypothetical protein
MTVCTKRNKAQTNALALNDLDTELSAEVLNEMAIEDQMLEFGQLPINALSSQNHSDCMKLKTRVKDKVMLILVGSGSTHSFISSHFVQLANLPTIQISPKRVHLANGQCLITDRMVKQLSCYCQGQHFTCNPIMQS